MLHSVRCLAKREPLTCEPGFSISAVRIFPEAEEVPKKGGGGCPLARCFYAQRQEEGLFYLSSFAMRWTVPVPIRSDLPTFRYPYWSCPRLTGHRAIVIELA